MYSKPRAKSSCLSSSPFYQYFMCELLQNRFFFFYFLDIKEVWFFFRKRIFYTTKGSKWSITIFCRFFFSPKKKFLKSYQVFGNLCIHAANWIDNTSDNLLKKSNPPFLWVLQHSKFFWQIIWMWTTMEKWITELQMPLNEKEFWFVVDLDLKMTPLLN